MIWIYLFLMLLHILCCVLTYLGIHTKTLNIHKYMFFVVVFLPFWGFMTVLLLHHQVATNYDGTKDIGVEKMRLDSEIYKSVTVEDKKGSAVVPIEEALLINSSKVRREIIMDVLNDNPKEYVEFLQKAGDNEDTEVVHYAVTAMVEISKENDYTLQEFERRHSAEPDNFQVLSEYCEFLWQCLTQGLMQGQVEVMNRNLYNELVRKKLSIKEDKADYISLAKNLLELKNYTEAEEAIKKAERLIPDSEEIILLKLEYYSQLGKGADIKRLLQDTDKKRIYLSQKAKEAIAFWQN